jgi:outer membrane protein OmpA-like peptidoglycan-associated protein
MESGTLPRLQPSGRRIVTEKAPPPVDLPKGIEIPAAAPDMPGDEGALIPPPVRDTSSPSPSLKPPAIDAEGKALPGARLELDTDIATFPFTRGSDAISRDVAPRLDKLAAVLQAHGGTRVTLTAYADNSDITPREARRLSLSRALALRDYLTAKGIPGSRIDVRALGANVPSGDMDRVDVKVN